MIKNYTTIIKKHSVEEIIIYLILAAGVLLSLAQFIYNRSLWLDESYLALNIIHKDGFELLKILDYGQVAPILFLQIEKIFSLLLPNTEYGLRLFPLLCFWGAIFFFYKIIKKLLHSPYAIIFALSLFVFNPTLIYYSSEVKQYMTDVFTLLALFYFVLKDYKAEQNRYYVLGIAGGIAIFLSNVAPIILATCGLYLLYEQFFVKKNKKIAALLAVFAVWLLLFALYYALFIHNHPSREGMIVFWSGKDAFLSCNNPVSFLVQKTEMILLVLSFNWTAISPSAFVLATFFVVTIIGIVALIRRKNIKAIVLIFVPITLHLFLSAFKLYPFDTRLLLYTLPCIIICCSVGFAVILNVVFYDLKIERFRLLAVLIPCIFFSVGYPVKIKKQEIKKSINYICTNISDNEAIYVYFGAVKAFQYYDDIGFVKCKVPVVNSTVECGHIAESVDELKTLAGKNWLLFSHSYEEEVEITSKLDSIGYTKLDEFNTVGSAVYLYDFGEISK